MEYKEIPKGATWETLPPGKYKLTHEDIDSEPKSGITVVVGTLGHKAATSPNDIQIYSSMKEPKTLHEWQKKKKGRS